MKTYTKEVLGNTTIMNGNDVRINISGETKCIYKGLADSKSKGEEITRDEFESFLTMNIGGDVLKSKRVIAKVIKEYTHDNVDYVVINIYIPGTLYEESIIHKAEYLKDFEKDTIEPILEFR